jgi:hypothetical protein
MTTRAFPILVLFAIACADGDARAGDAGDSAAAGPSRSDRVCAIFTKQEVEGFVGGSLREMDVGGPMDTGCSWESPRDEDVYVSIQVIPDVQYWETPHGAPGYETVSGIGRQAYVVPQFGGWQAGVLLDAKVASIQISGGAASRERALEFLQELARRI